MELKEWLYMLCTALGQITERIKKLEQRVTDLETVVQKEE